MFSSLLSPQSRFETGLARDPSATAIEGPFNKPLSTSWLAPYTLTGMEIYMPDDREYSRQRDTQKEVPQGSTGQATTTQPGAGDNVYLQFVLLVLLAFLVSKRL